MENSGLIYKKRETFLKIGEITGSLPPEKRRRIFKKVVFVHFALIVVPLIWYSISCFINKKPSVIKVTLVSPLFSMPDIPVITPPSGQPDRTTPPPRKSKPIKPKKSKWKPKKSNEITISKKVIKNTSKRPPGKKISAKDIETHLRKIYKQNSNRATVTSTQGNISRNYRDNLYTAIYHLWNQPARSELGGKYPIVDITLTVDSNGKVSKSRISQKSGVSAMDISVSRLLRDLKTLPSPPRGSMTFTVSLEIVD